MVVVFSCVVFATALSLSASAALYDFEDGIGPGWTEGGDVHWHLDDTESHNGTYSLKSGEIVCTGTSSISRDIEGPAEISFWWKKSRLIGTPDTSTQLVFSVDGRVEHMCKCDYWNIERYSILDNDTHKIKWIFEKNICYPQSKGAGWINDVDISNDVFQTYPDIKVKTWEMIASLNESVSILENNVSNLNDHASLMERNISTNERKLKLINNMFSLIDKNISTLEYNVSNLNDHVGIMERNISTNERKLDLINNKFSLIDKNISALEYNVLNSNDHVGLMERNISTNERKLKLINNMFSLIDKNISTLEYNVSNLNDHVGLMERNISTNKHNLDLINISLVDENVSILEHNVSNLNDHINEIDRNVSTIIDEMSSIQITITPNYIYMCPDTIVCISVLFDTFQKIKRTKYMEIKIDGEPNLSLKDFEGYGFLSNITKISNDTYKSDPDPFTPVNKASLKLVYSIPPNAVGNYTINLTRIELETISGCEISCVNPNKATIKVVTGKFDESMILEDDYCLCNDSNRYHQEKCYFECIRN